MSDAPLWACRVELHEEVTSTNDCARAAALRGEAAGLWVVARRQTAGRGRLGRPWHSPPGNFYGSLLLRPKRPLAECATLSLVAALAVAEAVEELVAGRIAPAVKWPNDVLVGPAKLAGILTEAIAGTMGSCEALVLGIGVNLAHHPTDIDRPATSLKALGLPVPTVDAFLTALDRRLQVRIGAWEREGFGAVRVSWLARAAGLGACVRIVVGDRVHEGRFVALESDGSILIEEPGGALRRFTAGELVLDQGSAPSSALARPL